MALRNVLSDGPDGDWSPYSAPRCLTDRESCASVEVRKTKSTMDYQEFLERERERESGEVGGWIIVVDEDIVSTNGPLWITRVDTLLKRSTDVASHRYHSING